MAHDINQFREYATKCLEMAEHAQNASDKQALMGLVKAWLRLVAGETHKRYTRKRYQQDDHPSLS